MSEEKLLSALRQERRHVKTLLAELHDSRQRQQQQQEQIGAFNELVTLFSAELNRQVEAQQGIREYWTVAWLDADEQEQREYFPLEHRPMADTLYDRLCATGVRVVDLVQVTIKKQNKEK